MVSTGPPLARPARCHRRPGPVGRRHLAGHERPWSRRSDFKPERLPGPKEGFRSRGELPLEALDHADAETAADALADINPEGYRPFNMVVADNREAFWIKLAETHWGVHAQVAPIPEGFSMVTASDRNDTSSARIRTYLPQFERASVPDPESADWLGWTTLLTSKIYDSLEGPEGAMLIATDGGFGTVSSSLIALPADENQEVMPRYLFAAGRPDQVSYVPVSLA